MIPNDILFGSCLGKPTNINSYYELAVSLLSKERMLLTDNEPSQRIRVAICFFGITRSLSLTFESINENILAPARKVGDVTLLAHFFRKAEIQNPRSGETGKLDTEEHALLELQWLNLEDPDVFIDPAWLDRIRRFGDEYEDDFKSIGNLIHQLHSLKQVSSAALAVGADVYIFARPDILYHNSFAKVLERARTTHRDTIYLPTWAHWGPGYNDRFCVCVGDNAVRAYAERLLLVEEYCASRGKLHAEKLARFAIKKSGVEVKFFSVRGSRVRSNGKVVKENFQDFRWIMLKDILKLPYRRLRRLWRKPPRS